MWKAAEKGPVGKYYNLYRFYLPEIPARLHFSSPALHKLIALSFSP